MLPTSCEMFSIKITKNTACIIALVDETKMPIADENKLERERKKHIIEKGNLCLIPDRLEDKMLITYKKWWITLLIKITAEHETLNTKRDSIVERTTSNSLFTENGFLHQLMTTRYHGTNVRVRKFGYVIKLIERRLIKPLW